MRSVPGCRPLQLQDSHKQNLRKGKSWRTVQFDLPTLRTKIVAQNMSELEAPAKIIHMYRMNGLYRGGSIFFLVVASFFLIAIWGGIAIGQREPKLPEIFIAPVLLIVGAIWVAVAFTSTVTLFHDAIELRTLVNRARLPFAGIRGLREYVVRDDEVNTRYLKLEPNDDRLPTLEFQQNYNFDSTFHNWFYQLPDLDELDKTKPKKSNFGLV